MDLLVATFNVQHGRTPAGRVDLDLLALTCAGLAVDVLGLQEVDVGMPRSGRADQAAAVARAGAMAHAFAAALRPPSGGEYGNALLVRGELAEVEVVGLPGGGDEPRAVLLARAEAGGGSLSVAVTHLAVNPVVALDQLDVVVAALAERPAPRVLLGDLNLEPDLVRPLFDRGGLQLAGGGPTFPARAPRTRIDHVAVAGLTLGEVRVVRRTPVSDHRPLVVELGGPGGAGS